MEQQVSQETAERIANQTFIFEFHCSSPTFRKKVQSDFLLNTVNPEYTQISPERLTVSKSLIDTKGTMREIWKHSRAFVTWIKQVSLPGGLLTPGYGQWLIPTTLLPEVRNKLEVFIRENHELVENFITEYPSLIEASVEKLGPLFDRSQYIDQDEVRERFSIRYKFVSNLIPEEFEKISKKIYEEEKQRIINECSATAHLIQDSLREQFAVLVAALGTKLQNDEETGKPRTFRRGTVDRLKDFVAIFKELNLTGDVELEKLVEQTQGLLSGADVKRIRSDEEFRAELSSSFQTLVSDAEKLITVKTRKINFEN